MGLVNTSGFTSGRSFNFTTIKLTIDLIVSDLISLLIEIISIVNQVYFVTDLS